MGGSDKKEPGAGGRGVLFPWYRLRLWRFVGKCTHARAESYNHT